MSSEFEKTAIENSDDNFICCLPSLGITAFVTAILTSIYREVVTKEKKYEKTRFSLFLMPTGTQELLFIQTNSLRSNHTQNTY